MPIVTDQLGHMFADVLDRGWELYHGRRPATEDRASRDHRSGPGPARHRAYLRRQQRRRILRGDQFIGRHPRPFPPGHARQAHHAAGEERERRADVRTDRRRCRRRSSWPAAAARSIWKTEFGVSADRLAALDRVTRLAIAAGIDALRDAGIPLVMRYKTTTKGTQLPDRWGLPDALRDDTGVIFGSAFPGYDSYAEIMASYYTDHARRDSWPCWRSWRAPSGERPLRAGPGDRPPHR